MYIPGPFDWFTSWKQKRHIRRLEASIRMVTEMGLVILINQLNMLPGAVNIMFIRPGMMPKPALWAVWWFCKLRDVKFYAVEIPTLAHLGIVISKTREESEAELAEQAKAKKEAADADLSAAQEQRKE